MNGKVKGGKYIIAVKSMGVEVNLNPILGTEWSVSKFSEPQLSCLENRDNNS